MSKTPEELAEEYADGVAQEFRWWAKKIWLDGYLKSKESLDYHYLIGARSLLLGLSDDLLKRRNNIERELDEIEKQGKRNENTLPTK